MSLQIDKYADQLRAFGEKWKVCELALFGSGLRDDIGSSSCLQSAPKGRHNVA